MLRMTTKQKYPPRLQRAKCYWRRVNILLTITYINQTKWSISPLLIIKMFYTMSIERKVERESPTYIIPSYKKYIADWYGCFIHNNFITHKNQRRINHRSVSVKRVITICWTLSMITPKQIYLQCILHFCRLVSTFSIYGNLRHCLQNVQKSIQRIYQIERKISKNCNARADWRR